jgi:hypothetical protein
MPRIAGRKYRRRVQNSRAIPPRSSVFSSYDCQRSSAGTSWVGTDVSSANSLRSTQDSSASYSVSQPGGRLRPPSASCFPSAAPCPRHRRYFWPHGTYRTLIFPFASGRCSRTDAMYGSIPHVHRNRPDTADLLSRQRLPEAVHAAPFAVFGHGQHSPSDKVVHQSQIALPLPKRLLINANLAQQQLGLAPSQTTLNCPVHNAVDHVPTQLQQPSHGFLAGGLQLLDYQRLTQGCESTRRLRPGKLDYLHSMMTAFGAWRFGVKDRLILASVQMAPSPLRLMVI